jgi:GntR family transcriptional regulator
MACTNPSIPRYQMIHMRLRQQIIDGAFDESRMPNEIDLAKQNNVARVTIRHAMAELVREGLIVRRRGQGTFVEPRCVANDPRPQRLTGMIDNIESSVTHTSVRVLEFGYMPSPVEVASQLMIEPQERVLRVVRVRLYDGKPLSYTVTFNPSRIGVLIKRKMLKKHPMLALIERSGVKIGDAAQAISARQADHHLEALLEAPFGSALLSVVRLVRDIDGNPIQLLQGLYRPDRYEFQMKLNREGHENSRVWIAA